MFWAEAGGFSKSFCCDYDGTLFGKAVRTHLTDNSSDIISSVAGRKSGNGLVEANWKTMVHMSRAYLTDKQMSRIYWFYSIWDAPRMMNMIPRKLHGQLSSPFMLVHGRRPDCRTWVPLFLLCYFYHEADGGDARSKNQANSVDGIVLGRSHTSNALLVYNQRNKQFYQPDSYHIDPHRILGAIYPMIKYDGSLFCSLKRDNPILQDEEFPPGTHVEYVNPSTHVSCMGTVMDIPMDHMVADEAKYYLVRFNYASTMKVPLVDMPSLVPRAPVSLPPSDTPLLTSFLHVGAKVTYEHEGQYYKGWLAHSDGTYHFSFKRHPNCKREEWGVPLHDLPCT